MTGAMLKVLERFHHWVARRVKGITAQHTPGREWECPPVTEELETSGICTIKEYIKLRQGTVAAQVACWIRYELCTGEEQMPGTSKFMW